MHACPLLTAGDAGFRPGPPEQRIQVGTPDAVIHIVRPLLLGCDRERGAIVSLDIRHRLISTTLVSIGTAAHTFLGPREVFRDALLAGASAIVVAHNHPSGDPTPSDEDRQITRRLVQAGVTLGVTVLDHLIVGDPTWRSLARRGVGGLGDADVWEPVA